MSNVPHAWSSGLTSLREGFGANVGRGFGLHANEAGEGPLTRVIEEQTAKLPSDLWLFAAACSILASLTYRMLGDSHKSLFVGQWAPTFLILGLYNKMVKQHGS